MQTLAYIEEKKYNGIDDIKEIVNDFYKKKITVSYEPLVENNSKRRVIFTCSKKVRNYTFDEIALECNGLILESIGEKWNALVVPMLSPKTDVNTRKINEWLSENIYEVCAMEDGTTINLYNYEGRWIISTARGFNMNDVKFNNLTYQVLLDECISRYTSTEDFYKALDENYCYTLGFKHPDMHPFREGKEEDIYKVWCIQKVNLAENSLVPQRGSFLKELPLQKKINFKTKNMHNLYKRLKSSYDDYISGRSPNYGYILVSNKPNTTKEFSVLMLESSLMKSIRNLWYNGTYVLCSKARECDRISLILLNSYLDDTRHATFLNLFPQFSEKFVEFEKKEDEMMGSIYAIIKKTNETETNAALQYLANEVQSTLTISLYSNPTQKIKDIIHCNKYIYAYYDLFF